MCTFANLLDNTRMLKRQFQLVIYSNCIYMKITEINNNNNNNNNNSYQKNYKSSKLFRKLYFSNNFKGQINYDWEVWYDIGIFFQRLQNGYLKHSIL